MTKVHNAWEPFHKHSLWYHGQLHDDDYHVSYCLIGNILLFLLEAYELMNIFPCRALPQELVSSHLSCLSSPSPHPSSLFPLYPSLLCAFFIRCISFSLWPLYRFLPFSYLPFGPVLLVICYPLTRSFQCLSHLPSFLHVYPYHVILSFHNHLKTILLRQLNINFLSCAFFYSYRSAAPPRPHSYYVLLPMDWSALLVEPLQISVSINRSKRAVTMCDVISEISSDLK